MIGHWKKIYVVGITLLAIFLAIGLTGSFLYTAPQPVPVTPQSTPVAVNSNPDKYLIAEAALLGVTDNISYYFQDLQSGQLSSLEPSRSWIPASTIKAFVAVEVFRQNRIGLISFDQSVTIQAKNVVPTELETTDFPRLREGTTATVQQLVEAMIIQSDNTAYNTLLDVLDRRSINNSLRDLGLTETVVGQKLNLDDSQQAIDETIPGYLPNTTTAKDYATLFDLLYNQKIPGATNILAIFKRQKINNMIPALLPQDTSVAHKTGDWDPIYHDGGIVYKPNDPFILAIFTNSGKPDVLANLARVAYYRNADSVGIAGVNSPGSPSAEVSPTTFLAETDENVLGAATTSGQVDKFPTITAADLGITQNDLTIDTGDNVKIRQALIIPGSPFYIYKLGLEKVQTLLALTPDQKAQELLDESTNRLSEAKTLLANKQLDKARQLLNESEQSLGQAVTLSKKSTNNQDSLLTQARQISDLQFSTLAENSSNVPLSQKENYVDTIYNLYQKEKTEVLPAVKTSVMSNPTAQKPSIAVVEKVDNNTLTVKFDNGTTKQVVASDFTPVRQFQSPTLQGAGVIQTGEKIAILGQTNNKGQIIPQFILRKLPAELPNKIQGTVLEINPIASSLTVLDNLGHKNVIQVTNETLIRSTGTSVSLAGIHVGSQLTVFSTETPLATPSASPIKIATPEAHSKPSTPATPPPQKSVEIKAVTITVTKNGSGKNEKVAPKPAPAKKPSPPPKTKKP